MGRHRFSIHAGCCGFAVAQAEYFRQFNAVEIDSSFYNLPRLETAARWRTAAPPGFVFTMKAWQVITHGPNSPTYQRTRLDPRDRPHSGGFQWNPTVRWAWDQTLAVAKELGAAVIVLQCPSSFRPTKDHLTNLRRFCERVNRGRVLLGWEPRGDWPPDLVETLCRELDLIPVGDPLCGSVPLVGPTRYFRLHGPSDRQRGYADEELGRLWEMCRIERRSAFCFFNNATMRTDARRFAVLTNSGLSSPVSEPRH